MPTTELFLTPEQWDALPDGERGIAWVWRGHGFDQWQSPYLWRIWEDESGTVQDADVFIVLDADELTKETPC